MRFRVLTRSFSLLALAALLAVMLATPAFAQHRDHGHGYPQSRQWHGALLGGALVAPPPVVYAPPPRYANPYAPPPPIYYGY